jgi:hypothetical protein
LRTETRQSLLYVTLLKLPASSNRRIINKPQELLAWLHWVSKMFPGMNKQISGEQKWVGIQPKDILGLEWALQ